MRLSREARIVLRAWGQVAQVREELQEAYYAALEELENNKLLFAPSVRGIPSPFSLTSEAADYLTREVVVVEGELRLTGVPYKVDIDGKDLYDVLCKYEGKRVQIYVREVEKKI